VQLTIKQANQLMNTDPHRFKTLVHERYTQKYILMPQLTKSNLNLHKLQTPLCSLCRQVEAINNLSDAGMFFWDYGNAFLLEAQRAGK